MDLQRDRSITLTQSYLINEETKVAVIPIMRNASSMLEYVLQQHNFTITKERRPDNSWTYYTVWRNPYERLISVLTNKAITHSANKAQLKERMKALENLGSKAVTGIDPRKKQTYDEIKAEVNKY